MRLLATAFAAVFAFQGRPARPDDPNAWRFADTLRVARSRCVPTAPMPVGGLRARPPEPMPIAKPDSVAPDSRMVIRLVACYLTDSARTTRPR